MLVTVQRITLGWLKLAVQCLTVRDNQNNNEPSKRLLPGSFQVVAAAGDIDVAETPADGLEPRSAVEVGEVSRARFAEGSPSSVG
eukprot:COSAG01_NODE_57298_length_313_cov_0.710280_1_plen_84_part_01